MDVMEKLVELIKEGIRKGLRARGDDRLDYSFEDVADYLIANGVTVQEWISVKDRLPDVGKFVLIYSEINGVCMDYHDGATFGYYGVTHWMSLPEPPKGE